MKQNTFKILFFLRSNYLNKDGTAAIIVRISIDGERQEWTTKLSCEPAKWDKKSGRAMGRSSKVFELNNHIQDIQTLLTNHYYDIQRRHGYVTAEMVRNAYMGITQREESLLKLYIFKSYVSHCRYRGKKHKGLYTRRLTEFAALFIP